VKAKSVSLSTNLTLEKTIIVGVIYGWGDKLETGFVISWHTFKLHVKEELFVDLFISYQTYTIVQHVNHGMSLIWKAYIFLSCPTLACLLCPIGINRLFQPVMVMH
jgi:hypothetical protein